MSFPDPLALGFWAVVVLGILMILFLSLFVLAAQQDSRPQFEGSWGGLGGGVGGWRISISVIFLSIAIALGIMATNIATTLINRRPSASVAVDKYQSVVRLMAQSNVRSIQAYEKGNKAIIKGEAPNVEVKNRIWDQIKLVNPALDDVVADITVPGSPKK
jgi:hypothetical protein